MAGQQAGGQQSGGTRGGGQQGGQPGGANSHPSNGGNQHFTPSSNSQGNNQPHNGNNQPNNGPRGGQNQGPTRTVHTNKGNTINYGGNGHVSSVTTHSGTVAHFGPNGHVASIHTQNTTIVHGPRGGRTIVSVHNNVRLVSYGTNRGYVQRSFTRGGSTYLQRTYVMNGHAYAHVYRGFQWHGGMYYRYVPAFRFAPAFYGWAYRPWGVSIGFNWGWGAWYPYYGYYFSPYPVYASPAFWLTDYILAAELQDAYQAQQDAQASENYAPPESSDQESSDNVTLSPEVKQAIADEVSAQLAAQQNGASNNQGGGNSAGPAPGDGSDQMPAALDPNQRTFIVSTAIDEQNPDGSACVLSPGDVLTRVTDTPDANGNVNVLVTSSQKGDCSSGSQFPISVQQLQDMHNDFRQQVDDGLQKLSQTAGQNGIPAAPPPGLTPNPAGQATPDPNAAAQLQSQQQEANQDESDVNQASSDAQQ